MFLYDNDFDEEFIDQSQKNENYDENNSYSQNQQYHPHTENPKLNTQVQVDRYRTLMNQDADTKNIPKTFGNNFKKFMDDQIQQNQQYFLDNPIPKKLENFINKKQTSKTADYTIQDFKEIFYCDQTKYWFQFYVENVLFLDLLNSNRINDPEKYIKFIEQYLAGAKDPENFISSRPIKDKKQILKFKKLNNKLEQIEVQSFQNLQDNEAPQNQDQFNLNQFPIINNEVNDIEFNDNYD